VGDGSYLGEGEENGKGGKSLAIFSFYRGKRERERDSVPILYAGVEPD
jgi:hypothetical protein